MTVKLAYSLKEAAGATGLSSKSLLRAINKGELRAKKTSRDADGNASGYWVIPAASLEAFIDGLADA